MLVKIVGGYLEVEMPEVQKPPGMWGGSNEPFPGYGLPGGQPKPPGSPPGTWGGAGEPFPGYGLPPSYGIWPSPGHPAHPIVIPPPTEGPQPPADGMAKPPPPNGGWGYSTEYGWGYFPGSQGAGPK